MNLNKVMIAGNLTREPELKYTPKGTAVCAFGLAINRRWNNELGQKQEETTFVDVTAFGVTADNCGKYLKKGAGAYVEGRLKFEQWDDKQTGQKRSALKIVAESVQFLSKAGGEQSASANAALKPAQPAPADDDGNSSVPF